MVAGRRLAVTTNRRRPSRRDFTGLPRWPANHADKREWGRGETGRGGGNILGAITICALRLVPPAVEKEASARRQGSSAALMRPGRDLPCILISIFLVRRTAAREDGSVLPPAGGRTAARACSLPSGTAPARSSGSRNRPCLGVRTRTVARAVRSLDRPRSYEQD